MTEEEYRTFVRARVTSIVERNKELLKALALSKPLKRGARPPLKAME